MSGQSSPSAEEIRAAVVTDRSHPEVAIVTMNRPERRNAMNAALLAGLYDDAR